MPNTIEEPVNGSEWVSTLKRLEKVRKDLRKPKSGVTVPEREDLQAKFLQLRESLPAGVMLAIRSRIDSEQPLVASAGGGRCGACYVAMSLGDHTATLAGAKIVPCQFCGVLLYADDSERRRVAILREARQKLRKSGVRK